LRRTGVALLLAGLLAALAGIDGAEAQTRPRDMIHAYRVWKLTEILELSEEDMPVFFSRLKDLDDKEAELVREEQKGIREIADLLAREDADENDLRQALDRHRQKRAQLLDEIRDLKENALSVLNTRQRCQYVVFEHRFRTELRDMIDRAKEMGRGGSEGTERTGRDEGFGRTDPGGRGAGGGMPGGSGRGRR
jgi:uncharacterized membrane protein